MSKCQLPPKPDLCTTPEEIISPTVVLYELKFVYGAKKFSFLIKKTTIRSAHQRHPLGRHKMRQDECFVA